MRIKNLVLSLFDRERFGKTYEQKFEEFLEYKTATLSTIHINYDLQEAARSTFVIAFSPDRTKIATSHGNHTIKVSDCYTFKVLLTLKGHPRTPWCVTFHPHINSLIASGCLGGQVRIWDLNKINDDNVIYQSQAVISSLSFHPVDDILAMSTHNKIIFYNWNTQQIVKTIQMKHHSESIRLVRFLCDGSKLITGITNASSQYCRPERLNVSTRGDPRGRNVVQTVSCMRMQQRCQEGRTSQRSSRGQQTESPKKASCSNKETEMSADKKENSDQDKMSTSYDKQNDSTKEGRAKHKISSAKLDFKDDNNVDDSIIPNKRTKTDNEMCGSSSSKETVADEPFHCRKQNESISAKRDRIPLSRKSCINFFRQPSSSFTPPPSTDEVNDPTVTSPEHESNMISSSINEEMAGSSTFDLTQENRHNLTSISTDATLTSTSTTEASSHFVTSVYSSGSSGNTSTGSSSVRIFIEDSNSNTNVVADSSTSSTNNHNSTNVNRNVSSSDEQSRTDNSSRPSSTNSNRQVRSEIWNFNLGPTNPSETSTTTSESLNELDISVEGAASTIPVHGYISFPFSNMDQNADVTNLLGVRTAVATATARSSHHVHTAVVIASQENENSETTLQTAVNRAIAGAFAGSGEGAVASNIIDTTHRLQLWDSSLDECPDIQDENKNVIVPVCKIHNDSSFDVSLDSSYVAVFVPSEFGFPNDAQIKVISLKQDNFLQCIYSRKYGPNAVSVSLSSLNNYLMIGLASRKLDWQLSSSHLIGQVLTLPILSHVNHEDKSKPVLNIQHKCNQNQRSNISVNTIRFHPTPGMGILYGTNRGHVQHCHIEPDYELNDIGLNFIRCMSK